MADLKSARLMYAKAFLLAGIGVLAATLILIETRSWRIAALLAAAIWGFCRSYYFAFYVIAGRERRGRTGVSRDKDC